MGRRRIKNVFQLITDNWSLITEIKFIYDGAYIIAETDGSGNVLRRYIRHGDQLLALEDTALGKTFYYYTDGNKNVTDMIDSDGVLAAHYEYDPFGRIVVKSGYYADTNPFRFSSEYFDKETGLVAYLYRFYSPEYCRFLNRDPIEEAGGINLYPMVGNDCVNKWDYLGLQDPECKEICRAIDRLKEQIKINADAVQALQSILERQSRLAGASKYLNTAGTVLSIGTGVASLGTLGASATQAGWQAFAKGGYQAVSLKMAQYGGRTAVQQAFRTGMAREATASIITSAGGYGLDRMADIGHKAAENTYENIKRAMEALGELNEQLLEERGKRKKEAKERCCDCR